MIRQLIKKIYLNNDTAQKPNIPVWILTMQISDYSTETFKEYLEKRKIIAESKIIQEWTRKKEEESLKEKMNPFWEFRIIEF